MSLGAKVRVIVAISSISVQVIAAAPTASADPPSPVPGPILPPLQVGEVVSIGPVAGTGTPTRDYGVGATDLCEFMDFPSELVQICGDSFAGQGVGFGRWFTPIALRVAGDSVNDADGIRYIGVTGVDKPLLADPPPPGASQLPSGVVQINRQNYLMVTTTKDLVPISSRLVKAEAARGGWRTISGSQREAEYAGGAQSQISGYYDPIPTPDSETGWVYIVADDFDRTSPVSLYRVAPQWFTDRSRWQSWSTAGWNSRSAPLWPDKAGELSMRQIDGKTVLSYFNSTTGNMEMRVAYDPTGLGTAPVTTVVRAGDWPDPPEALPEDNRLAQPYGGYISPGSTLDEVRVLVSQWNTGPRDRAPYRVLQLAVNPVKPWD